MASYLTVCPSNGSIFYSVSLQYEAHRKLFALLTFAERLKMLESKQNMKCNYGSCINPSQLLDNSSAAKFAALSWDPANHKKLSLNAYL